MGVRSTRTVTREWAEREALRLLGEKMGKVAILRDDELGELLNELTDSEYENFIVDDENAE